MSTRTTAQPLKSPAFPPQQQPTASNPTRPVGYYGIPFTTGDTIQFAAAGAPSSILATPPTMRLGANVLYVDGSTQEITVDVTASADRSTKTLTQSPSFTQQGWITSAGVSKIAGSAVQQSGEVYTQANLFRGTNPDNVVQFLRGYFYAGHIPSYPGVLEGPQDGVGHIYNLRTPSTSLAAAGVSWGPPSKARWKIHNAVIKLITSGTVGNRTILVYMTDLTAAPVAGTAGTNDIMEWVNSGAFGTGRTVAGSTTERYMIGRMGEATALGATLASTLQATELDVSNQAQGLFVQDLAQIDAAGDKVTLDLLVEEWFENQ